MRRYRIDFALVVLIGNLTRHLSTRPLVERDTSVLAHWYPIRTWVPDDSLRVLPGWLRVRMRHLLDCKMLYTGVSRADELCLRCSAWFAVSVIVDCAEVLPPSHVLGGQHFGPQRHQRSAHARRRCRGRG